jgi:hypothetical protein
MDLGERGQRKPEMPQFAVQHFAAAPVYARQENGVMQHELYSSDEQAHEQQANGLQSIFGALACPLPQDSDGLRRYLADLQTGLAAYREAWPPSRLRRRWWRTWLPGQAYPSVQAAASNTAETASAASSNSCAATAHSAVTR